MAKKAAPKKPLPKRKDPFSGEMFTPKRSNQRFASRATQVAYNNQQQQEKSTKKTQSRLKIVTDPLTGEKFKQTKVNQRFKTEANKIEYNNKKRKTVRNNKTKERQAIHDFLKHLERYKLKLPPKVVSEFLDNM